MSLSSFIERKDVREGFRSRVTRPPFKLDTPILAPPLTAHYGIVGTAFDYLLRFLLERINPHAQCSLWVAQHALSRIGLPPDGVDQKNLVEFHQSSKQKKAQWYFDDARRQHESYLKTGRVSDQLLLSTLRLAQLDIAYRVGPDYLDWASLDSPDPEDLKDLHRLFEVVKESEFVTKHTCILNPVFGAASSLVGGADADLILDDCLVDIKTTKVPRVDPDALYQLVGYYLLLGLAGVSQNGGRFESPSIASVGIYFARYAYLWRVPIEQIVPIESLPEFTKWLVETACPSKTNRSRFIRNFCGPLAVHVVEPARPSGPKRRRS